MNNEDQDQSPVDELVGEPESAADGHFNVGESEDIGFLHLEIERLNEELVQAKEQSLRAAAEAQNARRRAEQDVEKAHKFGLEKIISDMVVVVDNLERSLDASSADGADVNVLVEGVELTLKSLVDGLARHKVEQVNPEGEPFDPQLHQAMSAVEQGDVEPNTVINVYQKGYTLNGRLVRPAMVVVSKTPA